MSLPSYAELLDASMRWAGQAASGRWLNQADLGQLCALESRTPGALFDFELHRPLVAAFFGGTGVGKSSLLNRLAGQPIARTGVERPTSREISLYLHESAQLKNLPKNFPTERVRKASHRDERLRQVLWIDMPDIDSIEQSNRDLVFAWLPHIDVLIYVVSPERYRDDKGWRLLLAHGGEHAWVFVLNQWDRADPAQFEDFARVLAKGGFRDPILLRTDCREDFSARRPDDFEQLRESLHEMADSHVLSQLEDRQEKLRRDRLNVALSPLVAKLGGAAGFANLQAEWQTIWRKIRAELVTGLDWQIQVLARTIAAAGASALPQSRPPLTSSTGPEPGKPALQGDTPLWDHWADSRVRDAFDQCVISAAEDGYPALPIKQKLDAYAEQAGAAVANHVQVRLREALAKPGNAFVRIAIRVLGILSVLLPLATMTWVTYQVVTGFYRSNMEQVDYLGADFAIHSGLLISLSWLFPYFAYRKLRPSAEQTALKGLRAGLTSGLDALSDRVEAILQECDGNRTRVLRVGEELLSQIGAPLAPAGAAQAGILERILPGLTHEGKR
jgi:hypothetical protein